MDKTEHLGLDTVCGRRGHHAGVRMRDENDRTRVLTLDVLDKLLNVVFEAHGGDVRAGFTATQAVESNYLGINTTAEQLLRSRFPDPSTHPRPWHEDDFGFGHRKSVV